MRYVIAVCTVKGNGKPREYTLLLLYHRWEVLSIKYIICHIKEESLQILKEKNKDENLRKVLIVGLFYLLKTSVLPAVTADETITITIGNLFVNPSWNYGNTYG